MHPFSTPWKHQKTLRFADVFSGLRKVSLGTNGLKQCCHKLPSYDAMDITKIDVSKLFLKESALLISMQNLKHLEMLAFLANQHLILG